MKTGPFVLAASIAAAFAVMPDQTQAKPPVLNLAPASADTRDAPRVTLTPDNHTLWTLRNSQVTALKQTRSMAALPDQTPLNHMQLVLKRSDKSERALETLIVKLHDPVSSDFHHWLTPEQYGKNFGVAEKRSRRGCGVASIAGFRRQRGLSKPHADRLQRDRGSGKPVVPYTGKPVPTGQ
jgi:hypothetical protein